MLHERNDEAKAYFEEGDEAEFFDSPSELAEKVARYLANPEERESIAARGLKRCLESDYSIDRRMREATTAILTRLS